MDLVLLAAGCLCHGLGQETALLACSRSVWLQRRSDLSLPECENLGLAGDLGEVVAVVVPRIPIKMLALEKPLG